MQQTEDDGLTTPLNQRGVSLSARSKLVAVAIAVAVAAVGGIVVVSSNSVSTAQAVADARAPRQNTTTARVERRPLVDTISVRGAIVAPDTVTVAAPAGSTANGASSATVSAITVSVGDLVSGGKVVAEVSGRPIMLLGTPKGIFRDIFYGDSGADVSMLQEALRALMRNIRVSGTFDDATQSALASVYSDTGYAAPSKVPASEARAAALESSQLLQPLADAVDDARNAATVASTADGAAQEAAASVLNRAVRDLNTAREIERRKAALNGVYLAHSEITASAVASLTVVAIPAAVGSEPAPGKPLVVLGNPKLEGMAFLTGAEARGLKPGASASLTGTDLDTPLTATVGAVTKVEVSASTSDSSAASQSPLGSVATVERPFRLSLALTAPPPAGALGIGVLVTIVATATPAKVTAVPLIALREYGGKETVVSARDHKRWFVVTGMAAEGWVELTSGGPPAGTEVETR